MNTSASTKQNFTWLASSQATAVRSLGTHRWTVSRSFGEANIQHTLHHQATQNHYFSSTGSIQLLAGRKIHLPYLARWQTTLLLSLLGSAWIVFEKWASFSADAGVSGESARLMVGGALLTWISLVCADALMLRSFLVGDAPVLKLALTGLRVEPVAWALLDSSVPVWVSLLSPFLFFGMAASGVFPFHFGVGMAGSALLLLMLRTCPLLHGPLSSLLAQHRGLLDYPHELQLALSTWWHSKFHNPTQHAKTLDLDNEQVQQWKDTCALLYHVPSLSSFRIEWQQVEPGYRVVQHGQKDSYFGWIAAGTLAKIEQTTDGHQAPLGHIGVGSAFTQENELIAIETTIIARFYPQKLDANYDETRRKFMAFAQMSQAFDRCPTFQGLHFIFKELWLTKGRTVWVPEGTVLFETGESAAWMGMLVQGSLLTENQASESPSLGPDTLVGEEILQGNHHRTQTLLANKPIVMVRWESNWIQQWLPQANHDEAHVTSHVQLAAQVWE